jgi:putative Mg2+ transporter-C (MgtC) family protein
MPIALASAAIDLSVALVCGAIIGSERQIRQRMAGLRTNALVSLGACGFVIFSQLFPNEVSQSRVAAQVVSGIGFLGAGIIFRDGFNIHGVNTAATLWCSAGVGLLAGAGAWPYALLLTAFVVFINLGLRPLVKLLKTYTPAGMPATRHWRIVLTGTQASEPALRALVLKVLAESGLHLTELSVQARDGALDLTATAGGLGRSEDMMDQAATLLAAESAVLGLRWEALEEG